MRPHFRLILACAALAVALGGDWAVASRAPAPMARLAPGYGGVCEACDLSGRILANARLAGGDFRRANFSHAVLARADATGAVFERANFADADLSNATLARANLARADFTRANLAGADLRDTRGLTQAQLARACGDAETKLPRGLRVRACG